MTQYIENFKKGIVIDMRKKGYSYSEIQNAMHIPKSTIAFWLKGIKLSAEQSEKLKEKMLKTALANSERIKLKNRKLSEDIKKSSAKEIGRISKKELWLMGIMIYWRERLMLNKESDIQKGVNFTSSDPYLIKVFLKWLEEIGNIEKEEILLDIFINKDKKKNINEAISYWSEVTSYPESYFTHIYYIRRSKTLKTQISKKPFKKRHFEGSNLGMLRVRVRASSMLARQISGWMKGIQKQIMK